MKYFLRVWFILATAYVAIALAIGWIVSGSIVYPTETIAHVLIVPFLQAALVTALLQRRRAENAEAPAGQRR